MDSAHGRWQRSAPSAAASLLFAVTGLLLASSASGEDSVKIYFGSGCFWHVQHELVVAEQDVLGRDGGDLTAVSGYAGGTDSSNPICYGNYGDLGHTEVVQVDIPEPHVEAFAAVFWCLFVGKDRVDTMDVGADYRAALGLPGGMQSPLFSIINASQVGRVKQRFALEAGSGGDRDTLGEALVWVYDSDKFPFYPAEAYHQFHDDFMPGGNYPPAYNSLKAAAQESCRLAPTGCGSDGWSSPARCQNGAVPSGSTGDDRSTSGDSDDGGGAGGSGGGSGGGLRSDFGGNSISHGCPAGSTSESCGAARVALLCLGMSFGHPWLI